MGNTTTKKIRAAIYVRVSTDDQRNGYGLAFQLEDCKKAVIYDGCEIVSDQHIIDDSVTGSTDLRPGWQRLMELARAKEFDVIYFWKIDRMMRDEYHFFTYQKELDDLGIELRFATENLEDPLVRSIRVAIAADERRKIRERTRRGRELAAQQNKWVMGVPPYGYKMNETTKYLEIVDDQAQWVKAFFEWLVYEQCSLKEVARRANELQIPTKFKAENNPKRGGAGIWYPRTLGRMLTNELYTGSGYLRQYKRAMREPRTLDDPEYMRDEKDWIRIEVPQIISRTLFDQAREQLKRNSLFAKRKKQREYMFSGLLRCSRCQHRLKAQYHRPRSGTAKGSRSYFNSTWKKEIGPTKRCHYCGTIAESRLMPIWYALESILTDPAVVYDRLKDYATRDDHDYDDKLSLLEKRLVSLDKERERLNIAFLDVGSISEKEYKKRLKKNADTRKSVEEDRRKIKDIVISQREQKQRIDVITRLYENLKTKLHDSSYETKTKILRLFVSQVDIDIWDNRAVVEFTFPQPTDLFEGQLPRSTSPNGFTVAGQSLQRSSFKKYTLKVEVPLLSFNEIRTIHPTIARYNERKKSKISPLKRLAAEKSTHMQFLSLIE